MVAGGLGFRVIREIRRPARGIIDRLRRLTLGNICDAMNMLGAVGPAIRPIVAPQGRLTGPAITVKTRSGDYLMVVEALKVARPGDVLVVSTGGRPESCVWGGLLSARARDCHIAGLVTDGYVRDLEEMRRVGLPVFAAGLQSSSPSKLGPGEVNTPVALGGAVVLPGDIVVADEEGVVVVPADHAEDVCSRAEEAKAADEAKFREIAEHRWKEEYFADADAIFASRGGILQ